MTRHKPSDSETLIQSDKKVEALEQKARDLARSVETMREMTLLQSDSEIATLGHAHEQTVAMNEALMLGSLRQHELTEVAENLNAQLSAEITERKQTETDLRESEARLDKQSRLFHTTLSSITDFVYMFDKDGRFTFANQSLRDLLGITHEEIVGKNFFDLNYPDDLAVRLQHQIQHVFDTKEIVRDETPFTSPTGEDGFYEYILSPVIASDGTVEIVAGSTRDITFRKNEESRLALLARLGEITRTTDDPHALLFAVARAVGENFNVRRSLFNEIDLENDLEMVHRDYCRDAPSVAGKHKISAYSPITTDEMMAGRTVVNSDSKTDPRTAKLYRKIYAPAGERSYVAVPLMRGGRWVASLWVSDDKPRNWSDEEIRLLESIGERAWLAVEKLRNEAALRESEERFSKAFNSSPLAVTITSLQTGKLIDVNETFVNLTGYSRDEAIGRSTAEIGLWEKPADRDAELQKVKSDGQIRNMEYTFRMKGDREIVGLLSAELLELNGQACTLTVIQDITDRKRAEEALERNREELEERVRERTAELARTNMKLKKENARRLRIEREAIRLLKQIVTIQEDERTRIARDLHDELGQKLTALRLKLENAKEICNEQLVCDEIDATQTIANQIDADVSFLAWALHPVSLAESGLPAAIGSYLKEWARFSTIKADFHAKSWGQTRLEPEAEANLYRIVQEALNNAQKYANAKTVSVLLERRRYDILLIIEDDGIGFDPNQKRKGTGGLGLVGMRERAALLGGDVEIESSAGAGTTIFVRVPWSEPPAVADGLRGDSIQ